MRSGIAFVHSGPGRHPESRRRIPRPARFSHALLSGAAVALIVVIATGCAASTATLEPSSTASIAVAAGNAGGGGNGGGQAAATASSRPGAGAPYAIKQTQNRGGESISGQVCSTAAPFQVSTLTPTVDFTWSFTPQSSNSGTWSYDYAFPSLGESHAATGTYTIAPPAANGTLSLSLTGSDHVVFNGFDGNVPVTYGFALVPSATTTCPTG
jgi:hypothetical protein